MSIHNESDFDIEKVSIISPCYNAADYIKETYQYLVCQTYQNWEWIVVDDCSTDHSLQELREISNLDSRVLIFVNDVNSGAAITRNNCLNKASGELVAFLDIDDIWSPNKLKLQVSFMKQHGYKFTYHDYCLVDADAAFIKNQLTPVNVNAANLLKFNPFATSSVMISRGLIESHSIRFKIHLRRRQDYLFWYDVLLKCDKAYKINGNLSSYRLIGESSLSANKKKMAQIQWSLYRTEFKLNIIKSIYYFCHYAIHGVQKYFLK